MQNEQGVTVETLVNQGRINEAVDVVTGGMNKEKLKEMVPALDTLDPVGRSAKYNLVNTAEIVDVMAGQGFNVASAQQVRSKAGNEAFGKHLIRFRSAAYDLDLGDSVPEIILINSHDGGSAYRMMAGIFRFVCANGLIIADSTLAEIRIRHDNADIGREVVQAAYKIVNNTRDVAGVVQAWKGLHLNQEQRLEFFRGAKRLYDPEDKLDMKAGSMLYSSRRAEKDPTLWNTFNVIQERFIKGAFRAHVRESGQYRKAREITSIDRQVKLNRDLWEYTKEFNLN